jgi:hypothetical protein
MKKLFALALTGLIVFSIRVKADEGMWLLPLLEQLNMNKMHQLGCKLSADDIYNINKACLKDAIVNFGGICTGEVVSNQGLILTNHHCGFEAVQHHSTLEHDYLSDGFWAKSNAEELYTPDLNVTFLIRIEDVTSKVLAAVKEGAKEEDREKAIEEVKEKIQNEATAGTEYTAAVEDFFGANNFYLLIYEVYNDVRLVGTPPNSIGKFGYDTDNWMWPRHTGDFSVFRVYAGPDGKPAPYSKDNVPLKPRHFIPVSMKGIEKGDFTMVMGYPGNTERYITSFEVKDMMDETNPNRIKIRGIRQDILQKDMLADAKVRIMYSAKFSESSNYWKYSIGQNKGLKKLDVISRKQKQEQDFLEWVNADTHRKEMYGNTLNDIQDDIQQRKPYEHAYQYLTESFLQSTEIFLSGIRFFRLYNTILYTPDSTAQINSNIEQIRTSNIGFFKDFNLSTDKKVLAAICKLYDENVSPEYYPQFLKDAKDKYKGDYSKYAEYLYKKSFLADPLKVEAFLKKPSPKSLMKDPGFKATMDIIGKYLELNAITEKIDQKLKKAMRAYIAGTMEMNNGKAMYPDANFTMRLTYGTVGDYKARDAVHYDYYTTLSGVMEKEDTSNYEFAVPQKLKELYKKSDFGQYAQDGNVRVCFTTNNDITGGNSGSPVLNGNGELIGLAFDGNWEAMSGDVVYEPDIQKCICVDIRYVLFIIDKYAGDRRLIDEMQLVN